MRLTMLHAGMSFGAVLSIFTQPLIRLAAASATINLFIAPSLPASSRA